jgi:uncharacterized protein YgfB (UPF0149 family)
MIELLLFAIAVLLGLGMTQRKNHMATLTEAIDNLTATVQSGTAAIASAIEDLKNPNVDNSEAIARIEAVNVALTTSFEALKAADPTPGG